IDPLLGPLQNNGGPTFTHALLLGSPAIDKGESSSSTTDQRGFGRRKDISALANAPGGDGADIGAVESAFAKLANISTRLRVQTGDNAMIGGFIITGTQQKTVLVRGIGASLPLSGALVDPFIEVYGSAGEFLATNDNWRDATTRTEIENSGLAPTNDLEPALWGVINPGAYTVIVRGKNNTTGIGLFEVYDLDQTVESNLGNISTRGLVGTGDDVMIGGTIIDGSVPARVLFRAIGPSLTSFGVSNALGDPVLELHDGNGALIASNYDWRDTQEAEIGATGLAPSDNLESAIVRDLAPGNYTAIVRGLNNTTGVALIEAYNLN
ncbi:MAG: choice-of-anchor Q domain-containing protein, partial [Chthoniobacterales bacterium]